MCGFAGAWEREGGRLGSGLEDRVRAMIGRILHRGPDDEGIWTDPAAGLGLGFRRLAILDLTPTGHQPMRTRDGRGTLVFNGEIYNHRALRRELEGLGHTFVGRSDTEVLLAAFAQWGVAQALPRCWGMFAFAFWDGARRCLWLGRDRLGKKPLYYGWQGGSLLFGSELKALRAHPDFRGGVDPTSLELYLRHACVPSPRSIHPGISQVPPGGLLRLDEGSREADLIRYWEPAERMAQASEAGFRGGEAEAEEALHALLLDAVALRREADVPVGAFLSGGIDSSLVLALHQATGGGAARAYTIGFEEGGFDETIRAREIARHLGATHQEARLGSADALALIPRIPEIYDEPFADPSLLPTFLLCRWARQEVVVALSGDGGDEGFGGYWRTFAATPLLARLQRIPWPVRRAAAAGLGAFTPEGWDRWIGRLGLGGLAARHRLSGERLPKVAKVLAARGPADLHRALLTHGDSGAWLEAPPTGGEDPWVRDPGLADPLRWMMAQDARTYLPDDVLTKVDRASMAVSLEARAPLLDHRVLEFAWSLPVDFLVKPGRGKGLLRRVLRRYLPDDLFEAPKHGFEVPLATWLRGPLRSWAEAYLDPKRLQEAGLRPGPVRALWQAHLVGRRNHAEALWTLLVYLQWRETWA